MFCFAFSVAQIINDLTSPSPSSSWRSWHFGGYHGLFLSWLMSLLLQRRRGWINENM